jgi:hypothetical protein
LLLFSRASVSLSQKNKINYAVFTRFSFFVTKKQNKLN